MKTEEPNLPLASSILFPSNNVVSDEDFVIVWASANGYVAKIDSNGSHFSTVLCETLNQNYHEMDFLSMDIRGRYELKNRYHMQTSELSHTLKKLLFFGKRRKASEHHLENHLIKEEKKFKNNKKPRIVKDYDMSKPV